MTLNLNLDMPSHRGLHSQSSGQGLGNRQLSHEAGSNTDKIESPTHNNPLMFKMSSGYEPSSRHTGQFVSLGQRQDSYASSIISPTKQAGTLSFGNQFTIAVQKESLNFKDRHADRFKTTPNLQVVLVHADRCFVRQIRSSKQQVQAAAGCYLRRTFRDSFSLHA